MFNNLMRFLMGVSDQKPLQQLLAYSHQLSIYSLQMTELGKTSGGGRVELK